MTAIEKLDTEERDYIEAGVDEAFASLSSVYSTTLNSYWTVGKIVDSLDTKYGKSKLKVFAEELSKRLGPSADMSESLLYRCRQFYRRYTEEQLENLCRSPISWNQVTKALPASKDPDKVDEYIAKVQAGEIPAEGFAEGLREATGVKAKERKKEASHSDIPKDTRQGVGQCIVKAQSSLERVMDSFGDILMLADDYIKLTEEEKPNYSGQIEQLLTALNELVATATQTGEKVKATLGLT